MAGGRTGLYDVVSTHTSFTELLIRLKERWSAGGCLEASDFWKLRCGRMSEPTWRLVGLSNYV